MDCQGKFDSTGWPTGLPDEEKDELATMVRALIQSHAAIGRACDFADTVRTLALTSRDSGAVDEAKRLNESARDGWGSRAWKKFGPARRVELIEIEIMGAVRDHRYVAKSGWFLVSVTKEATRLAQAYGEPKVAS